MTRDDDSRPNAPTALLSFCDRHLVALATAVAAVFVHLRVLTEARLDREVARQILRASRPANVIGDLLLQSAPPFLVAACLGVTSQALTSRWARGKSGGGAILGLAAGFLVAAFVMPALVVLVLAIIGGPVLVLAYRRRGSALTRPPRAERAFGGVAGGAFLMQIVLLLGLGGMWLPRERVTTATSETVGYVLDRDGADLVVLRDSDRMVERLNVDHVKDRTICTASTEARWLNASMAQLLFRESQPPLPEC